MPAFRSRPEVDVPRQIIEARDSVGLTDAEVARLQVLADSIQVQVTLRRPHIFLLHRSVAPGVHMYGSAIQTLAL